MTDKNDQNDAVEAADGELQGEGNYKAAAEYRNAQKSFAADKDKVEAKAREAAEALDGQEGEELEAARKQTSGTD